MTIYPDINALKAAILSIIPDNNSNQISEGDIRDSFDHTIDTLDDLYVSELASVANDGLMSAAHYSKLDNISDAVLPLETGGDTAITTLQRIYRIDSAINIGPPPVTANSWFIVTSNTAGAQFAANDIANQQVVAVANAAADGWIYFWSSEGTHAVTTQSLKSDIPSNTQEARHVGGYYAVGDGVSLVYHWDAASTAADDGYDATHPGLVVQPTGVVGAGRWIAMVNTDAINARWYGAGDGGVNEHRYIQRAIDRCLYPQLWSGASYPCLRVLIPKGTYKTSDTIHVGYGDATKTLEIIGSGGVPYAALGTIIKPQFSDRPVINLQNTRGVVIDSLDIEGPDNGAQLSLTHPEPSTSLWDAELGPPANTRTALVGISIDAYSGTQPASPRYPDVTFPPGLALSQWGKVFSSFVRIRNCVIRFCVAGVATKPGGGGGSEGQADFVQLEDCWVQFCKYGFAVNGSQTRQNTLRSCNVSDCWAAMAGGVLGLTGVTSSMIIEGGSSFDRCAYGIYTQYLSWATNVVIRDSYSESLGSVIWAETGNNVANVTIEENVFKFYSGDDSDLAPYHVYAKACNLSYRNNLCWIPTSSSTVVRSVMSIAGDSTKLQLHGNLFRYLTPTSGASRAAGQALRVWTPNAGNGAGYLETQYSSNRGEYRPAKPDVGQDRPGSSCVYSAAGLWNVGFDSPNYSTAQVNDFISIGSNSSSESYVFKVVTTDGSTGTVQQINDVGAESLDQAGVQALWTAHETWGAIIRGSTANVEHGTDAEMLALSPSHDDRFTVMESTDEATWPVGFYKYDSTAGAWVQTG